MSERAYDISMGFIFAAVLAMCAAPVTLGLLGFA